MASHYISQELRNTVVATFQRRCAYCMTPAWLVGDNLTIDHVVPRSMGGETVFTNLCLACWACNTIKNDRITGIDPQTSQVFRLYHPHHMQWHQHFCWIEQGLYISGITPIGRTTVTTLQLNRLPLLETRRYWIQAGWHPPTPDE